MAYVDIPKDLDGIRSKAILGLTKKQLIGFGVAAAIGVPVFLTTRHAVGNDAGLLLMIASMALPLLYAIYEPKGMTVEQFIAAWLRFHFVSIGPRPYKTINLYDALTNSTFLIHNSQLETEVTNGYAKGKNAIPAKTGGKRGRKGRRPA